MGYQFGVFRINRKRQIKQGEGVVANSVFQNLKIFIRLVRELLIPEGSINFGIS
jgi:hypothetical protein